MVADARAVRTFSVQGIPPLLLIGFPTVSWGEREAYSTRESHSLGKRGEGGFSGLLAARCDRIDCRRTFSPGSSAILGERVGLDYVYGHQRRLEERTAILQAEAARRQRIKESRAAITRQWIDEESTSPWLSGCVTYLPARFAL